MSSKLEFSPVDVNIYYINLSLSERYLTFGHIGLHTVFFCHLAYILYASFVSWNDIHFYIECDGHVLQILTFVGIGGHVYRHRSIKMCTNL